MKDYISIGSTPCDEDCAQVGSTDYYDRMYAESARFIEGLRKRFGPEPTGARLRVKAFAHDFGAYHEVVCHFDTELPESERYAFKLHNECPPTWEELES